MAKISVSSTGCVLMDYLYSGISFTEGPVTGYFSRVEGDGGLSPGKLVFTRELETFAGKSYREILHDITGGKEPEAMNIGGPGIVAMIHLSQMLGPDCDVKFYGAVGRDTTADTIRELLAKTPLSDRFIRTFPSTTPFTHVLSDPEYDHGHGERIFINNIGAAGDLDFPDPSFFESEVVVFGGTALVPRIHDSLHILLEHSKRKGAFTVVNTVYDFRSQKANPGRPWPLGDGTPTYRLIDLLIVDKEEACKLSGSRDSEGAMDFFISAGTAGVIITDGARPVLVYGNASLYRDAIRTSLPVSQSVIEDVKSSDVKGDTTGCGDNFAGGVIYSIVKQLSDSAEKPDLREAANWGIASGGFALFYLGGTYYESQVFEKFDLVQGYVRRADSR
ncbi:MAG TPA: carbohydrate kinase family protein [Bacteroidales bacterium]|nr:carbohydrate kinase family protein [Bacteroidales bacterium]